MIKTNISVSNLTELIDYISKNKNSCNAIINDIKKEPKTYDLGNGRYKFIVNDLSDNIKVIVVDCYKNNLTAITFYGHFLISNFELIDLFGAERVVYDFRDNITFHFFNETKGECVVSYFNEGKEAIEEATIFNITLKPN